MAKPKNGETPNAPDSNAGAGAEPAVSVTVEDRRKPAMTAAQAAALVHRTVAVLSPPGTSKGGKPTGEVRQVAITEAEVFAFRDHGSFVVVVTVDGHKFRGAK